MAKVEGQIRRVPLPKDLKRLVVGQSINMMGDSFSAIALTWFIVQTGTAAQMGMNLALAFIPNILLAPIIGNIVDRFSRKLLLWGSDILRLFLDLALILVISKGWFSIYIIYTYTVAKAIVRLAYIPGQRAVIQQLTTSEQRVQANALQELFARIGMVVGPVLAGIAVTKWAMQWVIAVDAVTFLFSALIILSLNLDEDHILLARKVSSYWLQMKEGFSYVSTQRWIIFLSFAFAFVNGGNALANVARPFFIGDRLGLDADAFGLLTSLGSIGAMVVSAVLVKVTLKGHKLAYVAAAIAVWSVGIMLLSITNSFWLVVAVQLITVAMGPLMVINTNAFYQDKIPPEYMGRVYAVRSFISTLAMPVGYLFGSTLMDNFGIEGTFILAGLVIAVGAGLSYLARHYHDSRAALVAREL